MTICKDCGWEIENGSCDAAGCGGQGKLDLREIPCTLCGTKTNMLGTKLCDRCWELKSRIEASPELASKILQNLAISSKS